MNRPALLLCFSVVLVGCSRQGEAPAPQVSGIIRYTYGKNPQRFYSRIYNWEVLLNRADSSSGPYEIVQIGPPSEDPEVSIAEAEVLVEHWRVAPNRDDLIHFYIHFAEKEPTQNMPVPGYIGQPIIFEGTGTRVVVIAWTMLRGTAVQQVVPSGDGTPLSGGSLTLVEIVTSSEDGKAHRAKVVLRRAGGAIEPARPTDAASQ